MMIPDVNLLIYAYMVDSPHHERASTWWEDALSGTETVGLPSLVLLGFVRIATQTRLFAHPIPIAVATRHVRAWLAEPNVLLLDLSVADVERALRLIEDLGTAGDLVSDAQIAASALAHDAVVHTADAHFRRFPGLRWYNPITGAGSSGPN